MSSGSTCYSDGCRAVRGAFRMVIEHWGCLVLLYPDLFIFASHDCWGGEAPKQLRWMEVDCWYGTGNWPILSRRQRAILGVRIDVLLDSPTYPDGVGGNSLEQVAKCH